MSGGRLLGVFALAWGIGHPPLSAQSALNRAVRMADNREPAIPRAE